MLRVKARAMPVPNAAWFGWSLPCAVERLAPQIGPKNEEPLQIENRAKAVEVFASAGKGVAAQVPTGRRRRCRLHLAHSNNSICHVPSAALGRPPTSAVPVWRCSLSVMLKRQSLECTLRIVEPVALRILDKLAGSLFRELNSWGFVHDPCGI